MKETALTLKEDVFGLENKFLELSISQNVFLKEASFAMQAIATNPRLGDCPRASILTAVYNLALTGLTLNPALGYAYLVPRSKKCVLDISYRGLLKLATDTGGIRSVNANCVYENDTFEAQEGTNPTILHKPDYFGDRGEFKGVYVVATLADGSKKHHIMSKEEVDKIRDVSMYNGPDSIWGKWYDQMAIKSCIKRSQKLWPHSEKLANAIQILNEVEGLSEPILKTMKASVKAPKQLETTQQGATEPPPKPSGKGKAKLLSQKDIDEITAKAHDKTITVKELCKKMKINDIEEMALSEKQRILDYIESEF